MEKDNTKINIREKFVLLDIEGTTTSIKFVKDTLFPYVRENMLKYVLKSLGNEELQSCINLIKEQYSMDVANHVENLVAIEVGKNEISCIVNNLLWQMDLDRKTTCLKKLQGCIWREGYYSGELRGHVYDDVPLALEEWKKSGKKLYVYSSGSIEAQKLLFSYSTKGNLLPLFSGHFDTEVGAKVESSSYKKIAEYIGCPPDDIIFLTDIITEAEAASKAGCNVLVVQRPGNAPITDEYRTNYKFIQSFDQLIAS